MPTPEATIATLFTSRRESLRIAEILRKETVGGALLVVAALVAIVWANSPVGDSYAAPLPLALCAWALMHASGIHATVAGVLLGFAVPVVRRSAGDGPGLAEHFEHRFRLLSAGVAVPVFAFLSAGVAVGGGAGLVSAWRDPVATGVMAGLVFGKPLGILAATFVVGRLTRATLDSQLGTVDVAGLGLLAGIGFTVSLLIGEPAFGVGSPLDEHVKVAVLSGSLVAALLATVLLRLVARRRTSDSDKAPAPDPG